jgi:hypothetical protein
MDRVPVLRANEVSGSDRSGAGLAIEYCNRAGPVYDCVGFDMADSQLYTPI